METDQVSKWSIIQVHLSSSTEQLVAIWREHEVGDAIGVGLADGEYALVGWLDVDSNCW